MILSTFKNNLIKNWNTLKDKILFQFLNVGNRTLPILQIEATECGSTSLAMILAYYKKYVSLEELRIACGVNRNGSKASNIIKAARNYGMNANGAQIDSITELEKDYFPLIAFWEFNHFLVLEGYNDKFVHINDPAQGHISLPHKSFSKSFTGVVILMQPGPNFVADGTSPFTFPDPKPIIARYKFLFIFMLIAAIASLIPATVIPGASKLFIDDILVNKFYNWFRPLAILVTIVAALGSLISWLQQSFLLKVNIRITSWLATRFLWHLLNLPISFFASRFTGEIIARTNSIYSFTNLISEGASGALTNITTAIFYLLLMFTISIKLTFIVLALAAIGFAVTIFHRHYIGLSNSLLLGTKSRLIGTEMGGLQSIETLRSGGTEFDFLNKRASLFARNNSNVQRLASYEISLEISNQFIMSLTNIILIGYGSYMIMNGEMSIGTLIAFQILVAGFVTPLSVLSTLSASLQEAKVNLIRLKDALNHPVTPDALIPKLALKKTIEGHIKMKDVSFAYAPTDPPVLKDININIPAKSTCALVGRSGNGKSTLALLLAGLNPTTTGEITIDNIPLEKFDQETRTQTIGMIDSDLGIFEGTLLENITLFRDDYHKKNLEEIIRISCIDDIIERIGGIQGYITESGSNLSGGQRQRIEIARLLYQGSKIMILDEATSNLDRHRDVQIQKNLRELGHTLIIISHRLSSIQDADQILVIDGGEIVDSGRHEELLSRNVLYAQLVGSEQE